MTGETCTLCDLPTPDPPVTDGAVEGTFCCRGCLEVARTLPDDGAGADNHDPDQELGDGRGRDTPVADADTESAFLAVDGMHCATCEAFLETRAEDEAGVADAEASYPADLVKVVYDPDQVDAADLPALLSGAGYEATLADDDGGEGTDTVARLLVGGFFGMMTMVWYVLFIYPVHLGVAPDRLLLDPTGPAGSYLLWNVWLMTTLVLGYTGAPILRGAYVSLRAGLPNMDLLVALAAGTAYVYSTVTLLLGGFEVYFDITTVVVLAVTLGEHYETRMKARATDRLTDLTESRVNEARRRTEAGEETVPIESVDPGDELVVGTGERVPVDGVVIEGAAAVDEALVTGESSPVRRAVGDEVVGGGLVVEGGVVVAAGAGATSTLDRLIEHLWEVRSSRPGIQRLADRLAAVFVPLVVVLAVAATGVHLALGAAPTAAVLTGLATLVVSCPCALGLATPLAVATGVREALASGVVLTDGSVFERAPDADVVAFDKTGTLTAGEMRLVDTVGSDAAIARAAALESFADHPMGRAVVEAVGAPGVEVASFERHPGRGVSGVVDGEEVTVGSADLFDGADVPDGFRERYDRAVASGRVAAFVGWAGVVRGVLVAGDRPRPEWEATVDAVAEDVDRVVVLTGDGEAAAARFAAHPAVEEVFAGVPPEGKAAVVDRLREDGTVVMVGDGSNDAPALAAADLGISLESGTRLAADAADAVVATDDLSTVPAVFDVTAATRRRVRENLGWAFCYNAIAIPTALLGYLNPLVAAVAMAASSLLVVANSARPLGGRSPGEAVSDPTGADAPDPSGESQTAA
jgi:Cu2+-exporting ATPase